MEIRTEQTRGVSRLATAAVVVGGAEITLSAETSKASSYCWSSGAGSWKISVFFIKTFSKVRPVLFLCS